MLERETLERHCKDMDKKQTWKSLQEAKNKFVQETGILDSIELFYLIGPNLYYMFSKDHTTEIEFCTIGRQDSDDFYLNMFIVEGVVYKKKQW